MRSVILPAAINDPPGVALVVMMGGHTPGLSMYHHEGYFLKIDLDQVTTIHGGMLGQDRFNKPSRFLWLLDLGQGVPILRAVV